MSARARMQDTLERLEHWMREHQPAFLEAMLPGATDAELDQLERDIGRQLPEDVRAFYRWRNGIAEEALQTGDYLADKNPFWGQPLPLDLVRALHSLDSWAQHNTPECPCWWHPGWVPIFDLDGGSLLLCVDTAGVWTGVRGQIIWFDNKGTGRTIEAASLGDWLRVLVVDLEQGHVFDESGQRREGARNQHPFGYPDYRYKAESRLVIPADSLVPPATTSVSNGALVPSVGSRVLVKEPSPFAGIEATVIRLDPEIIIQCVMWGDPLDVPVPADQLTLIEAADAATLACEWDSSSDASRLFDLLGRNASVRKLWLFAAAIWQDREGLPQLSINEKLEQLADGTVTTSDIIQDLESLWAGITDYHIRQRIGWATHWLRRAVYEGASDVATLGRAFESGSGTPPFVREIFPNPFVPPRFDPVWRTANVTGLANAIYAERAFDQMPILADALQEAGCDNDDILNHCRNTSAKHVRGCWVLDLCLGRE